MIFKTTEGIKSVLYLLTFEALSGFLPFFPFQLLQDFFFYNFLLVWRTSFSHYLREGLATNSFSFLSFENVFCLLSWKIITGYRICLVQFSRSVMSDCLWPHGLQLAKPPCPSPTPRVYSNSCPLIFVVDNFFFSQQLKNLLCWSAWFSLCIWGTPWTLVDAWADRRGFPRAGHPVPLVGEGSPQPQDVGNLPGLGVSCGGIPLLMPLSHLFVVSWQEEGCFRQQRRRQHHVVANSSRLWSVLFSLLLDSPDVIGGTSFLDHYLLIGGSWRCWVRITFLCWWGQGAHKMPYPILLFHLWGPLSPFPPLYIFQIFLCLPPILCPGFILILREEKGETRVCHLLPTGNPLNFRFCLGGLTAFKSFFSISFRDWGIWK